MYILKMLGILLHMATLTGSLIAGFPSQQMHSPDKSVPSVVAEASPSDSKFIEVRVTMKNTTHSDLYVPTITIPSDKGARARALVILRHKETGEWVNVGHVYDIPTDTALRLQPGQSQVFIDDLIEGHMPLPSKESGVPFNKQTSMPIQGKLKVRLGYFRGHERWQAYINYVAKYSGPSPHIEFVESAEFEIAESAPKP